MATRSCSSSTTSSPRARPVRTRATPTAATARARPTAPACCRRRRCVTGSPACRPRPDVESVVLGGDFNSYAKEDPLQVLYDRRLHQRGAAVRQRRVLLLVLRSVRLARPHPRQRRGSRPVDGHRHLEHQRRRVAGAGVQPLELPRDRLPRRRSLPLLRPRPGDPGSPERGAGRGHHDRRADPRHQRLPRPHPQRGRPNGVTAAGRRCGDPLRCGEAAARREPQHGVRGRR